MEQKKIVTLIGSMRFWDDILNTADKLEKEGIAVLIPYKSKEEVITPNLKDKLDKTIRLKIDVSNEVLVININDYIGKSVSSEIEYAKSKGIPVKYLVPHDHKTQIITLCGSRRFIDKFKEVENKLTLEGNIVLTPSIFEFTEYEVASFSDVQHSILDQIHESKILMSDKVLVINEGGYIGENTQQEINFCTVNNIETEFLEEPV